jgi:hypothetical protein
MEVKACARKYVRPMNSVVMPRFETVDDAQRRQNDLLQVLAATSVEHRRYAALTNCGPDHCGCARCAEACWFGTRRRRLFELPAAYRVIKESKGPIYRARVIRSRWGQPIGRLRDVGIQAARLLNRRALDSLYKPSLVAVGLFKVGLPSGYEAPYWTAEIDQLVAGAQKEELENAFPKERYEKGPLKHANLREYSGLSDAEVTELEALKARLEYRSFVWVAEVESIGQAVNQVFERSVHAWQDILQLIPDVSPVQRPHQAEYYTWLLGLPVNARIIRYGCDRYFNKLQKQPRSRPFRSQVRRRRPYPHWLTPFMFGNHPPDCLCQACGGPGKGRW